MSDKYLVQPDLAYINELEMLGADTLKKCFQCATCSVACPIAPENSPFPRKEMIAASWGLKDKLVSNGDIWLCHECGDCSDLCPRGARPGDVLSAIRYTAIKEYARPKFLANAVEDPKKLPFLIAIPGLWFALLAYITMTAGDTMTKIFSTFGIEWSHGGHGEIAHANFFSTWFVDMTFVPIATLVVIIFALSLKRFVTDIHQNAVDEGKTDKTSIEIKGFLQSLIKVLPVVLKHDKFNQCEANHDRATAHMMVLYSFIGLFIVTSIFFVVLYIFSIPGPYSQLNPVKWLANISGAALVIGATLMIKNRLGKKDLVSTYKDWYILGIVLSLGVTGLLTEMTRLAGYAGVSYFIYWLHLITIFNLFAFLPFSKMAHLVYRTTAMAYAEYANRK
ncbi:QmoC [Desulforapulum autotrophicum HRM2]|uniref:QmoC n=1 Tax=Desulforapulum autotrophicum (strain ATCC 43914 / DSM 3382 / VKM B-1955 / HRM2) TaxID=177437 RepID=C0QHK5_DESAH|nr:quinone-interacting membrane-bound oxidoreductase complex subunit QmoC [Desulforapulum autotrophicum]ACN13563.1 QmoC [Desulforapulum autotrophicum HRM2]